MNKDSFFNGNCFDAYNYFGAHPHQLEEENGYIFRVFAPLAKTVLLAGDFNNWQATPMERDSTGIWSIFTPHAAPGMIYKYNIVSNTGEMVEKCDPYGRQMELPPLSGTIIPSPEVFAFSDEPWMTTRNKNYTQPLSIYELHFGSWKQKPNNSHYTYTEILDLLIPYIKENGFTHIEILPLNEHPFTGSWGYQASGFFSVTSRYGTPQEFKEFVNRCHQNGIGIIMDFVIVHFVADAFSLRNFDGTPLYEYDPPDIAYNEWGSCNFNYFRNETCSFLMSAANLWLEEYHLDGLRMDAVSNVIYWQGDKARGVNPGGISFLQRINSGLSKLHPTAMLIAEDSSDYTKVTAPVEYGGLGFDYKWDMGWMHDTLNFFKTPPAERVHHYHKLSFSMLYFYNDLYLLPLSHDEVVHGKATILQQMWGGYEDKFTQGRAFYTYMFTHPGKKLNFMGFELGHLREWDETRELDWSLLTYPIHDAFHHFLQDLHQVYRSHPALYQGDYNSNDFRWLEVHADEDIVYVYERKAGDERIVIALNLSDQPKHNFTVGYDTPAELNLLLHSDDQQYNGATQTDKKPIVTLPLPKNQWKHSFPLNLPAFSAVIYKVTKPIRKEKSPPKSTAKKSAKKPSKQT